MTNYFLEVNGYCPLCEENVIFHSKYRWLRDHFICSKCGSRPRERALIEVINMYYPNYRELKIHESSPLPWGASLKLRNECKQYSLSHYYPDLKPGSYHELNKHRNENLEKLTFNDNEFDIFISQDVMEHIFNPDKAFNEIKRVLKKRGAHIFTVPLINKEKATEIWASRVEDGRIIYHHEPEYHGNPIDDKGSLVTIHWGYDICEYIMKETGMVSTIVYIDNLSKGIQAEYIEVICSRKY